jgi:hypothetical protein
MGFFAYTIESLFYAIFFAPIFLAYAYLVSRAEERKAFYLSLLSIPIAFLYTYFIPDASPATWALVGLMLAYNHHAIIEDMAMGDVYIIPLYFMILGPFALIPYSLVYAMGEILFLSEERKGFPVGPALFVTAIPVYIAMSAAKGKAFLFTFQSIHTHPLLAVAMFVIGAYYIVYVDAENLLRGITGGIMALFALAVYSAFVMWLDKKFDVSDLKLFLLFIIGIILIGGLLLEAALKIRLHYHGTSTVPIEDLQVYMAFCLAVSAGLTAYLLWHALERGPLSDISLAWIPVLVAVFASLRIFVTRWWDVKLRIVEGILGGVWIGLLIAVL